MNLKFVFALFCILIPCISYAGDHQGKVVIVPLGGFGNATVVTPVGGNNKLTIGEQRSEVFQRAAFIWSNILDLHYDITVEVTFEGLECDGGGALLGYAGPNRVKKDNNVWYATAQANQILKADTSSTHNDIYASFNSSIDTGCYSGASAGWYYGLDNNEPSNKEALLDVVLHEIGHGLGFLSFVQLEGDPTASPAIEAGALFNGYIDSYSRFLKDYSTGKAWQDMSNAERSASKNNNTLIWTGTNGNGDAGAGGSSELSSGFISSGIKMHAPSSFKSGSSVSHISTAATPNQLMEPYNTDDGLHPVLEIQMFKDMGYELKDELSGNSKPVASDYTLDITVNGSINLEALSHASDLDADVLSLYTFKTLPTNGSLSNNFDASATYTPNNGFIGTDTIVYQVYDDHLQLSNEAMITINVTSLVIPPTANDDSASLNEDSANYLINVLTNDVAGDNALNTATLTIASQGAHGTAISVNGAISYTPTTNYYGSDTIGYHVKDTAGLQSNSAFLTLTINNIDDTAISSADNFTLIEDSTGHVLDLINNDSDIDSTLNNNQVMIVNQAAHGSALVDGSGVTFTPQLNYFGSDSFTYKLLVDGSESNISNVILNISGLNDAPISNPDSYSLNNTLTTLDLLINDSDIDHGLHELQVIIQSQPTHGVVIVNSGAVSYKADDGYIGVDSFSYSLKDPDNAISNISNVDIQVTNSVLPIAVTDSYIFDEDVSNKSLSLTSNDSFTGAITQISINQQPENGHISVNGLNVMFTADADEFGQSEFSYQFTDQTGLQSQITTGSIMLINKNDMPKTVSESLIAVNGLTNRLRILLNDTDESLENVTINILSNPRYGEITTDANQVYYTINDAAQTQDSFSYSITDKEGLSSNTATVTLNIENQLPRVSAINDEYLMKIGSSKQLNVLNNDTTYTDVFSIDITQQVSAGELTLSGTNLSYIADGSTNQDSFKYTILDEQGQVSNEATVVINKSEATPLKAYDDSMQVEENVNINLVLTDNDEFDSISALTLYSDTSTGRVIKIDNYQVNYQASSQDDSFVYSIENESGDVKFAQVYITIKQANEVPLNEPTPDSVYDPGTPDSVDDPSISDPIDNARTDNPEVINTTSNHKSGGAVIFLLLFLILLTAVFIRLEANR